MFISCGSVNLRWLLFLLVPTLIYFCNFIESYSKSDKNLFFFAFLRFFSRSLSCILWLILYKSISFQKNIKKKEENFQRKEEDPDELLLSNINNNLSEDNSISQSKTYVSEYILYKKKLKNKNKDILKKYKANNIIILYTAILDFVSTTVKYIFGYLKYIQNISGGLNVLSSCARLALMTSLSYFLISNQKLKKHQYFSAIIILFVVIIISILSFFMEDKESNNNYWAKLILMSIPEILYCFMYISGAYYLVKTQGNIYKLVFFNGIIGLTLSFIFQIILSFCSCGHVKSFFADESIVCNKEKIKIFFQNFTSFQNFGGGLTFLLIIVKIICIWLLIYYFSITHFAAVFIIPSFIEFIFKEKNLKFKIFSLIGCILIIFMALIYNEIIILKFCGLDKNTKVEISKRSESESNLKLIEEEKKNLDGYSDNNILDYSFEDTLAS